MQSVRQRLESLGTFLPSMKFKPKPNETPKDMRARIKDLIDTSIAENFKEIDNSFSLDNYNFVTAELGNEKIANVYRVLGPFDYGSYDRKKEMADERGDNDDDESKEDSDDDDRKAYLQDYWDTRRSGAQFRGEVMSESKRPHGMGIKVFNKNSLYEGYFKDGTCHGAGRGITSNGECYQGMFEDDEMNGLGMFYWPDGRIYEGDFLGGKKQGKGRMFW